MEIHSSRMPLRNDFDVASVRYGNMITSDSSLAIDKPIVRQLFEKMT